MPTYKLEKENGKTLYSSKLSNLPMHKDFIKPNTLQKVRKGKN